MKTRQASFHFYATEESPKGEDRLPSRNNISALGLRFSKGGTGIQADPRQVPRGIRGYVSVSATLKFTYFFN